MNVKAKSLSVESPDGNTLLEDVDISVSKGETVLICGGPGSGKTTLCKALKGILPENFSISGSIEVNGDSGFLFQSPERQIVRERVIEDLAFGLENLGLPSEEIAKRIRKSSRRYGLEELLNRDTSNLSSGEKAKVALTGVLVTEPDVLILDEPLSMLDAPNKTMVLNQIEKIKTEDRALIISEHQIKELLPLIDEVVILRNGRVKRQGEPKDVLVDIKSEGLRLPFEQELRLEGE